MTTNYITSVGVQPFNIKIPSGSTSHTATISAVGSGAFILFDGINPSVANVPTEDYAYVTLTNSTTITATRNSGAAGTTTVYGCIVDGDTTNLIKSVQYGTVTIAATAGSGTASISPVTNANAAVHLLGWSSANATFSNINEDPVLSLSGTTVTATIPSGVAGSGLVVGFVVIEFQGSALTANAVQNVSATSSSSVTSFTASLTNNVVMNNSLCIYAGSNIAAVTTDFAELKMYGTLTGVGTVTVNINTAIADAKTYNCSIVEFNSGVLNSAVQRGTTTLTGVTSGSSTASNTKIAYTGITWLGNSSNTTATDVNRAEGAVTVSQAPTILNDTAGTTLNTTIPSSTAGSMLILGICIFSGSGALTITGVTDNKSQTWIQVPGARGSGTDPEASDIWYFPNSVAGVTSVTATRSGGTFISAEVLEVAGLATSSPVDTSGNITNGTLGSTNVTAALTTTAVNDFIYTIMATSVTTTIGVNTPYTSTNMANDCGGAYNIPATTVSGQTATFTSTSIIGDYCSSSVAFFANTTSPNIITVTKNNTNGNITGSWEIFEFPAFMAAFNPAWAYRSSLAFTGSSS